MAEPRKLNLPKAKSVRYERNFITTAVCECRFPTLLELETSPPTNFQARIRKAYPFYEPQIVESSGPEGLAREQRYLFRSKDKGWTVSVRSFAIALETTAYTEFEDFFERLKLVLDHGRDLVDSDFFTRVGLRYVNSIPIEDDEIDGWINPDLVLPLTRDVFGKPEKYSGFLMGYTDYGQYAFRYGLRKPEDGSKLPELSFLLDYDYFDENVEFEQVYELVSRFHEMNFAFFRWCLGDKAQRLLGKQTLKGAS